MTSVRKGVGAEGTDKWTALGFGPIKDEGLLRRDAGGSTCTDVFLCWSLNSKGDLGVRDCHRDTQETGRGWDPIGGTSK